MDVIAVLSGGISTYTSTTIRYEGPACTLLALSQSHSILLHWKVHSHAGLSRHTFPRVLVRNLTSRHQSAYQEPNVRFLPDALRLMHEH